MSPTNALGHRFIELLTVDSTNNYAMGLVHAGMAQHGIVVFAQEQTQGKGQRHKQWTSAAYENILMSIIVRPFELSIKEQFLLSMSTAIAIHKFFSSYAGNETKVKWPNDIYWRDRKAGGILIENNIQGKDWKYAVIGVGLNINQVSFQVFKKEAVSLKQITGKQYCTITLARELLAALEEAFKKMIADSKAVLEQYHNILYKRNETVSLKKGNLVFDAVIKGVNEQGQLIAEHGVEQLFNLGEIEWVH